MDIYALHEKMTGHLFPAYSNTDERFLMLGLCGETGELANNDGQNYVNSETFGPMRGILFRGPNKFRVRSIVDGSRVSFQVKTLSAAKRLRRKLERQEWGEFACQR